MQEPYKEGGVYQCSPESYVGPREKSGDGLTGESSGQPLSSEISLLCVPTSSCEGNATRSVSVLKTAN
jgi:hypothetical protein